MEYKIYFLTVFSASCMKASGFTNTLSTSFLPIISNSIHASSSHILLSSANEEVDAYETSFGNPAYKYHRDPNDNMDHPLDVSTINHLLQKRSEYKKNRILKKQTLFETIFNLNMELASMIRHVCGVLNGR